MLAMDEVRSKTQRLLNRLQSKYGMAPKSPELGCLPVTSPFKFVFKDAEEAAGGDGSGDGKPPAVHAWYLVDVHNKKLRLPRTMLFLGRDECDIIIQSGTVDKRHAVITFDLYLSRFKVKDLSTTNGTYVNESRIPEQEYVTLNHMDSIRLGYDSKVYHMEQGEPCGDSPPPPPPPLTLQPPKQTTEGQETEENSQDSPQAWTSHHGDRMAECQGCIAEQKIEHTCTHAHHPGHAQPHHHHQHQFVDVQRRSDHEHVCELGADTPDHDTEQDEDLEQHKPRVGRNTWPRKKVRQVAHVASLFEGEEDSVDVGEIMVESGSNYFVSVDDSVCDGGRLAHEYSYNRGDVVQRIPRNSKNPLPPELETVKKGTPLYGQPSWWGEDMDPDEGGVDSQGTEQKSSRPSNLGVQAEELHYEQQQYHAHKECKAVYMEIPHKATTPERDKPARDKTTPARSVTSSISKDSLVLSPDSTREKSVEKEFSSAKGSLAVDTPSNPALSFTVDFGDEKKPKLKRGSAPLSQFVPTKLRNSLNSHARPEKGSSRGKESGGSCKNSEEGELSSPVRQKRLSTDESEMVSKGKSTRRSSGQATGVASLRTADFASEGTPITARSKDAGKSQDARKWSPRTPATKSSTPASKASKAKPQTTAAAIAATVQAAQYSDPTAYLIDRMFAGASGSTMDSPRSDSSEHERSSSPAAPEHAMYKEARDFDKASQRGGQTRKPNGKTSVQRQKSLSKSPANNGKSPSSSTSKSPAGVSPRNPSQKTVVKTPEKLPRACKEKTFETETLCSPPENVLEAPSLVTGEDQEDKVSEAGTYTIEAEEDGDEELVARQQIDEVFGVDVNSLSLERPIIDSLDRLLSAEEDDEGEKTLHEDEEGDETGCRTPCEEEADVFDDDEDADMARCVGEEEVPSWINQLNALTAASCVTPTKDAQRKESAGKCSDDISRKPPQGMLNRRRPGTGRKLPSIPPANDQSPVSSVDSSQFLDNCPVSPASSLNGLVPTRLENGCDENQDASPLGDAKFSPIVSDAKFSPIVSSKSRGEGSPCGSEDSGHNTNNGFVPKGMSVCSRGSIDTELLLRDTETVMAAMEARMGFRSDVRDEDEGGSDTDLSSTVAMVNGDDDFVKASKYHSPRDTLTGKLSKDKDNSNIRIASVSSSSKKTIARSFSEQKAPSKGEKSPRSGTGVSVVSDVFSRAESLDQSFQSDASDGASDRTDGGFTRSGSRGKGTITMTKPNRAFALRRARADGETTETKRTRTTTASSAPTSMAKRSSSIHGTSRAPYSDRTGSGTGRSDATSLGGQIVRKAQENAGASKPRDGSATRQDGLHRNSLRLSDRRSSASSSASSTISSAKKERDIRSLKNQLKSDAVSKDLAVTGVSSRSQSQPGSRSNSPKAAERMAWKRRKEYDPRKAVAEAKANKAKDPRPKPKVQSSNLYKQRMTRSASFTNSVELSGRVRHDTYTVDSTSSVDDLSSAATATDSYGETSFRRAFMPFHNPLRSDRLTHSADEDEAGTFPTSQDPHISRKPPSHPVSLKLHKSAFTPPLSKLHTPSPDSPSPQTSLIRRRTVGGMDYDEAGASTASSTHRTQADSYATVSNSPQSYDSLIVSSIYQLSLKLKTSMDKALNKLREQDRASITPSPTDDFLGHTAKNELPAWRSANQELAGVLRNLRKMEHHLHLMERALFPDEDTDTDVSGMSSSEKHKYFQEIERIRSELAGFHPIDSPHTDSLDPGSPEMAELSKNVH